MSARQSVSGRPARARGKALPDPPPELEEGVAREAWVLAARMQYEMLAEANEEAERLHFPGSPTLRVNGGDLFPVPERHTWALGCRTYQTSEGLKGWPTREMIRGALAARNLVPDVS